MENEQTKAVDDFLGGLKNDGQEDPLKPQDDPFVEKKEEVQEEVVEEVKEEKPLPFHKDPKVQRYIEKEISKRISDVPVREEKSQDLEKTYADILAPLVGTDTPEKMAVLNELNRALIEREEKMSSKAWERLQQEQQEEIQAEKEAEDTLMSGFEAIEEGHGIDITSSAPQARKLRSQFIDFVRKVAPKDEQGEITEFPDLEQTFEVFQSTRQTQPQANRAKELASRSSERGDSGGSEVIKERVSWDSFERLKDKLAG